MDAKQAFFVEGTDGRKFKMVIRGDLGKLSVGKIRRYLKSYGVPESCDLLAGSRVLEDDLLGEEFGLENDCVLYVRDPSTIQRSGSVSVPPAPPPQQQHRLSYAPEEAWRDPRNNMAAKNTQETERNMERLQQQLEAAKARNADLENQLAAVAKSSTARPPRVGVQGGSPSSDVDGLQMAKESLRMLGQKLRVTLQFDKNLTCVVGTDADFSLLLTYDPSTERLYIYSSLLTELPDDPPLRMKLYEVLLEGSLLGREVCGGGVGLSTQNNVVVLTTSLPVRHCSPEALCDVMPSFVETLGRWRTLIDELIR